MKAESQDRGEGGETLSVAEVLRLQGENVVAMYGIVSDETRPISDRMTASSRMTQAVHAWVNSHREYMTDERISVLEAEVFRGKYGPFSGNSAPIGGTIKA